MIAEEIGERLEARADERTARQTLRRQSSLRGVRGVPPADIARIAAETWRAHRPSLPDARGELNALFGQAYEDGLVAIGLLAAAWSEDPDGAKEIGFDWAERVDDIFTGDALGWLVLGPIGLGTGAWVEILDELSAHRRTEGRRTVAAMALAACPVVVEGPAAAPLREKIGQRSVQMVDQVQTGPVRSVLDRLVRDPDPSVRKALRRVLRAYATGAPEDAVDWAAGVSGGLPKLLGDEIKRARRRAK